MEVWHDIRIGDKVSVKSGIYDDIDSSGHIVKHIRIGASWRGKDVAWLTNYTHAIELSYLVLEERNAAPDFKITYTVIGLCCGGYIIEGIDTEYPSLTHHMLVDYCGAEIYR